MILVIIIIFLIFVMFKLCKREKFNSNMTQQAADARYFAMMSAGNHAPYALLR